MLQGIGPPGWRFLSRVLQPRFRDKRSFLDLRAPQVQTESDALLKRVKTRSLDASKHIAQARLNTLLNASKHIAETRQNTLLKRVKPGDKGTEGRPGVHSEW